jgi:hypothetical protein
MPFIYPTAAEIDTIESDLTARNEQGRLGLQLMPIVGRNTAKVRWKQRDNYHGLQALRGLDGAPTRVNRVGQKIYEYEPGVFGEFVDITETELTTRAGDVDILSTPIDVSDITMEADEYLIQRELDRVESSIWTLLTTGTISIKLDGPDGTQIGWQDTYPIQQYTATTPWSNNGGSTPITNFQAVQQLGQAAGHSVDLGGGAMACMNNVTANRLLNNSNAADLSGKRVNFGNSINSIPNVNQFLIAQNLPKIVTYDFGYFSKPKAVGGIYQKFIPDGVVVVVGARPGNVAIGNYIKTRNANVGFAAKSYRFVIDRMNGQNAERRVPPNMEVHRGHNGGPAIYYPSAIVVMYV